MVYKCVSTVDFFFVERQKKKKCVLKDLKDIFCFREGKLIHETQGLCLYRKLR